MVEVLLSSEVARWGRRWRKLPNGGGGSQRLQMAAVTVEGHCPLGAPVAEATEWRWRYRPELAF